MWQYNYPNELVHHGVLGMKWGHRTSGKNVESKTKRSVKSFVKENMVPNNTPKKKEPVSESNKAMSLAKNSIKEVGSSELGKRGKSALDVLMNGDSDWMGNKTYSNDSATEMKNRGKAAAERLLYSKDQIENKKFFGRYDF